MHPVTLAVWVLFGVLFVILTARYVARRADPRRPVILFSVGGMIICTLSATSTAPDLIGYSDWSWFCLILFALATLLGAIASFTARRRW